MAGDLEDLRRSALEEEVPVDAYEDYLVREVHSDKIFGMTPVERMFLSIGCFVLTSLAGFFLLLIMDKIVI